MTEQLQKLWIKSIYLLTQKEHGMTEISKKGWNNAEGYMDTEAENVQ